jgi:hypothetical protein
MLLSFLSPWTLPRKEVSCNPHVFSAARGATAVGFFATTNTRELTNQDKSLLIHERLSAKHYRLSGPSI